jgi:hypothetical protein
MQYRDAFPNTSVGTLRTIVWEEVELAAWFCLYWDEQEQNYLRHQISINLKM